LKQDQLDPEDLKDPLSRSVPEDPAQLKQDLLDPQGQSAPEDLQPLKQDP
jgi:hypothetical protein